MNYLNNQFKRFNFFKEYQPNFVILYEPNLDQIRELTTNQYLIQPNLLYKVYVLMYQQSIESELYLNSAKIEEEAFVSLLVQLEKKPKIIELPAQRIKTDNNRSVSTRIGLGAEYFESIKPKIIVDTREFKSLLPSYLYHEGFCVVPVMLATGDYILSDEMAVERKSVETADFITSLKCGKLEK